MFMVREVVNCRPGKVGALVAMFKEVGALMTEMGLAPFRLYTDFSGGNFWTLVLERDYEGLDEIQALDSRVFGDERAKSIMAGYHELVKGGHREVYKIES